MSKKHRNPPITVGAFELEIQSLERLYTFRWPEEVSGFLQAHPFLVPLLLEAHSKIAEYFGPSPQVILEVFTDQEAENDRELFVLIQTRLNPQAVLANLDRLDQEWWLEVLPIAQCKMTIDVEYY